MSVSPSDIAFIEELFHHLGAITHRRMMGGLSIYFDTQIFAILSGDGTVFLKATGDFAQKMANQGSRQFGEGGKTMGYWTLPDAALDDPDTASDWARQALSHL